MAIIKEIFNIKKGKKATTILDKPDANSLRFLQIGDLRNDNNLKFTNETESVRVNENDVIIAWDGANAGTIGFGLNGVIGSTLARLSLKKDYKNKCNSIYLGYFLSSKFDYFQNTATGATIPHISRFALERLTIPLPDLETQNKIVAILDKAKIILDKRKKTIAKYDELLRATFIEMFGDPFLNPRGWEKKAIGTICEKIVDCPHSTPAYLESKSNFPCIRTSEIKNGEIDWDSMKYISQESYVERIARLRPEKNDIVFGREGTVGEALLIPDNLNISLGQRVMLFRVDENQINPIFFWAQIVSNAIQFEIERKIIGATVKRINIRDIIKINFIVPPIELQHQFAQIIKQFLILKRRIKTHQDKSNILLNSLSQQVFSKRITIDIDAEIEALINAIDFDKKNEENKIDTIVNDITFIQRLIDRLNEQEFEDKDQYNKAKYIIFRIMTEEGYLVKQVFDEETKRVKLTV